MAEPSRKRTFQARENVWGSFESMARERGTPVDDLVTEAMSAYAKARGYRVEHVPEPRITEMQDRFAETQDRSALQPPYGIGNGAPVDPYAGAPIDDSDDNGDLARTSNRIAPRRPDAPPDAYRDTDTRTRPRYPAPPPRASASSRLPPPVAPPPAEAWSPRPPPHSLGPATMPIQAREPPRDALKRLVLTYEGQTYAVDKDRFLLGRSKTQADLRLDDPNVSRQHAVIERVGAAWFVVDLGSTNGVIVGGERVARRSISDGDLIVITAHEIRCSLR